MQKILFKIVAVVAIIAAHIPVAMSSQTTMKITTDIPASIPSADEVETRTGALRFKGGFPDEATAQKMAKNYKLHTPPNVPMKYF